MSSATWRESRSTSIRSAHAWRSGRRCFRRTSLIRPTARSGGCFRSDPRSAGSRRAPTASTSATSIGLSRSPSSASKPRSTHRCTWRTWRRQRTLAGCSTAPRRRSTSSGSTTRRGSPWTTSSSSDGPRRTPRPWPRPISGASTHGFASVSPAARPPERLVGALDAARRRSKPTVPGLTGSAAPLFVRRAWRTRGCRRRGSP